MWLILHVHVCISLCFKKCLVFIFMFILSFLKKNNNNNLYALYWLLDR